MAGEIGTNTVKYISKITLPDGTAYTLRDRNVLYGTCSTAASTVTKQVYLADSTISSTEVSTDTVVAGTFLAVKFTNSNTADSPNLTIHNSTGAHLLFSARSIKKFGTSAAGTTEDTSWRAGAVVLFLYDGTNWIEVSGIDDNDKATAWAENHTLNIYTSISNGDGDNY